jgi:hypothetical protein
MKVDPPDAREPQDPSFDAVAAHIGLATLGSVQPERSKRADAMAQELKKRAFGRGGKMLIGLYSCFIGLAEQVCALSGRPSIQNVLEEFETTQSRAEPGETVATLTIFATDQQGAERQVGLRGLYNVFSDFVRGPQLARHGYPSSPGHTTSRWHHNRDDLQVIFSMTQGERRYLAEAIWDLLLTLPRWKRRLPPRQVKDPFAQALREFDRRARNGETSGAALQGFVYGFLVADAPYLQFHTAGARTGAKRAGLVGDVDGYDGPDLALTAEVKDRHMDNSEAIIDFYGNVAPWDDAIAFIACRSATNEFANDVEANGIGVYTLDQLIDQVELWVIPKQLAAIRHTMGYFEFYEKKPDLADRFEGFLTKRKIDLRG